jgi:hypothetical protein
MCRAMPRFTIGDRYIGNRGWNQFSMKYSTCAEPAGREGERDGGLGQDFVSHPCGVKGGPLCEQPGTPFAKSAKN